MPQHYIYRNAPNYLEKDQGILNVEILEVFYPLWVSLLPKEEPS